MQISPFIMETWFKKYRNQAKYNLADSGVRDFNLQQILEMCDQDISVLNDIKLDYPNSSGSIQLRTAIRNTYNSAKTENILVTTSTSEALFVLFNVLLKPGDNVICEFPAFQALYEVPISLECEVKFLNLSEENNYQPDVNELTDLIDDKTKLIIVNNPHNPTGSVLKTETAEEIIQIAKEKNIFLLSDEHYRFLPLKEDKIQSLYDLDNYVITTGSITKSFGMIGLRMGWLICSKEILDECRIFKDYLTHVLSPISDFLATQVLNNREVFLKKNILMIKKNVVVLAELLKKYEHNMNWIPPIGGAVCFPKLTNKINSDVFCSNLIQEHKVFLLPGSCFNKPHHFRMCLGLENDVFFNAIKKIDSLLS